MTKTSKVSVWMRKKLRIDAAESVSDPNTIKKKKIDKRKKRGNFRLLSYDEIPDYMKDNEFILDYYRANWPVKEAFFSLFKWHNETLNVWTHLLGFLLFVGLTVGNLMDVPRVADFMTTITQHILSSAEANAEKNFSSGIRSTFLEMNQESMLKMSTFSPEISTTRWPFYVFLCGTMFCLLSSSICHLFSCHSRTLNSHLLHMDYIGITIMIIASLFPLIYYIFQCTPHLQILYLTGLALMGICTIIALLSPALSSRKYRLIRAGLFVCIGLFGLFPPTYAVLLSWHDPHRNIILTYESSMAMSFFMGGVFYVGRIPERWKPGWFDLGGHSHQIFHVFVVMGALAHYAAAQVLFKYRSKMGCNTFI